MGLAFAVVFALNVLMGLVAGGQAIEAPRASGVFSASDWGLSGIDTIRKGQLGLVDSPSGTRILVYYVTARPASGAGHHSDGHMPRTDRGMVLVSNFDRGNRNRLGGFFNTFQRHPAVAEAGLASAPDGRRGLRFRCIREPETFCGMWIHLFESSVRPAERAYLDSRRLRALTFWIRGSEESEILLKVADADFERREDAVPVNPASAFLPSGKIESRWQLATVPLSKLPKRIDRSALASLVFEVQSTGETEVFVSALAFLEEEDAAPALPKPSPSSLKLDDIPKGAWIWNTRELAADSAGRNALVEFLSDQGISSVFLQIPDDTLRRGLQGEIKISRDEMRTVTRALNQRGVRVYALDGYAAYALPSYHEGVLRTVENVIRYNESVREEEKVYGIRYDIEPYLLPGFHGPSRDFVLLNFLHLLAEMASSAREANLVFAVDIPFWYDALSEFSAEPVSVTFRGRTKPASHHIIDLVDEVAIMDYRTMAYGADGTIRHGLSEVKYASSVGKPIMIGLETFELPDEVLIDFEGEPRRDAPPAPNELQYVAMCSEGDSVRVEVHDPGSFATDSTAAEHSDQCGDPDSRTVWWPVKRETYVPGDKLSFARLGWARLERTMKETAEEFQRYPSFAGFAIHHADTYRDLFLRSASPRAREELLESR